MYLKHHKADGLWMSQS